MLALYTWSPCYTMVVWMFKRAAGAARLVISWAGGLGVPPIVIMHRPLMNECTRELVGSSGRESQGCKERLRASHLQGCKLSQQFLGWSGASHWVGQGGVGRCFGTGLYTPAPKRNGIMQWQTYNSQGQRAHQTQPCRIPRPAAAPPCSGGRSAPTWRGRPWSRTHQPAGHAASQPDPAVRGADQAARQGARQQAARDLGKPSGPPRAVQGARGRGLGGEGRGGTKSGGGKEGDKVEEGRGLGQNCEWEMGVGRP